MGMQTQFEVTSNQSPVTRKKVKIMEFTSNQTPVASNPEKRKNQIFSGYRLLVSGDSRTEWAQNGLV